MTTTASIKKEAKKHLSNNNWAKAISMVLIVFAVSFLQKYLSGLLKPLLNLNSDGAVSDLPQSASMGSVLLSTSIVGSFVFDIVLGILFLFIIAPLLLGVVKWTYSVANGNSPSLNEIFYYFTNKDLYIRSLKFYFQLLIRTIIIFIITYVPAIVCFSIAAFGSGIPSNVVVVLYSLSSFLSFAGYIVFMVVVLRYFLASYLFVINDESDPVNCIKVSWEKMKGNRMKVIKLLFSFILWLLLCIFVLPLLYVVPYMMISQAVCAKWLLDLLNKTEE